MKIRYAIFDLDGTLTDSMEIWERIAGDYLLSAGVQPPAGLAAELKAMSLFDACDFLRVRYQLADDTETIMAKVNEMVGEQYRSDVPLKPGAFELCHRLKDFGAKLCVATASDRGMTEAALSRLGVLGCFSFLLTCSELGRGKDDPLIYLTAAKKLGAGPGETVVFEDALHGIETAKKAGFPVFGVYDRSARPDEERIRALCDRYLKDFWELVNEL